jgi:putative ABC transport system permease protein
VEVFRAVPVRLRFGANSYRTAIRGMENGGRLQRLLDTGLRPVALPAQGIMLTDFLADMLGVRSGDRLQVEVLEGWRPVREVVVAGVVREYIGVSGYMQLQALNALMHEGPALSGAWLAVDGAALPSLYQRLARMPRVAGMAQREQEIRNFNRMMEQTLLFFSSIATVFAVIIAYGVIYNSARIALTERGHELASLRVLGFTRAEIAYILLGELGLLTLLALPTGLLLGRAMCHYIARALQNDLFRVPVVLESRTYAFAVAVVVVSAILSALAVRRRLDQLDLVGVLKTAE